MDQLKRPRKDEKKCLVLLDAHAILHRAYHALPDFTSKKGEPTGALYGFSLMLLKIAAEFKPDYIIACFDRPEPTYRHATYAEYKAKRPKADEALIHQLIRARDLCVAFNIPVYEEPGFEADDILGTIVEKMKGAKNAEIIIASGDMDTLQLIEGKRVRVYTLKKGIKDTILYDESAVKERYGFDPKLLPDFKGLAGDPSDNIIGVAGIGEKTASMLVGQFGTIEAIYKKLKKDRPALVEAGIKPRAISLLEEGEEEALFSKELARIRHDAPIIFLLPEKRWRAGFEVEKVSVFLNELGFRSLVQRVKEIFLPEGDEHSLESSDENETGGEEVVQKALANKESSVLESREFKEAAIALSLLDSNINNPILDDILHFTNTPALEQARERLLFEIKKHGLERVYREIELPLIPIIARMEARGVRIDRAYLENLSRIYTIELKKLEKKIYDAAGQEFNVNSPKQLGEILFDKLELWVKGLKKTPTGARSTRESELMKLRGAHPVVDHIFEYRELQKLLSTYIDTLPSTLDEDSRLHTTYLQTGTTTGRISSINPNLQNIPIKTELGRNIRKAFVAAEGFKLLALDYSQIELRIAAILSEDEKLIDVFKHGQDVHAAVAAEVFNVPPELVDKEMRRQAKVINFGILYGMGVTALQQNLGASRAEAQQFYNEYFQDFGGLARYLEFTKASAAQKGYTETFFGRRRYFEDIHSSIPYIRASAERMAVNAPVQGSAADVIKLAMIRVDEYLERDGLRDDVRLLLQVHDELVYEVRDTLVERLASKIKEIMETVMSLQETKGVPLEVKVEVGKNWGDLVGI